jgi:hypothetical protein
MPKSSIYQVRGLLMIEHVVVHVLISGRVTNVLGEVCGEGYIDKVGCSIRYELSSGDDII